MIIYPDNGRLPFQLDIGRECRIDSSSTPASTNAALLTVLHTLIIPENILFEDDTSLLIHASGVALGAAGTKSFSITRETITPPTSQLLVGLSALLNNNQGWHLYATWDRLTSARVVFNLLLCAAADYGTGSAAAPIQTQRDLVLNPAEAQQFVFRAQCSNAADTITQFKSRATLI